MSLFSKVASAIAKRSPGILAGAAVGGFFVATYIAIKETPKANLAIDNATTAKGEDLSVKEKAVIYAKSYWKPVAIMVVSTLAVVASVRAGAKKRAALEAALAITTSTLTTQSDKIIEKYGKEAFEALQASVAKDRISAKPQDNKLPTKTNDTQEGITIYHDAYTGVEFETTPTRIIEGVSEANKLIRRNDELTINEFFDCISTKHYDDGMLPRHIGDIFGWSQWKGPVELEYKIIDSEIRDGVTYLIMGFNTQPVDKLGR